MSMNVSSSSEAFSEGVELLNQIAKLNEMYYYA